MTETSSIRSSFLIVTLLALVWLGLCAWAMVGESAEPETPFQAIQMLGVILMPVAALYALAAALGNRAAVPVLRQSDVLEETEARLAGTTARIESLKSALADELVALNATAAALETQSRTAQALVADLSAASLKAADASRALEATIPRAEAASATLGTAMRQTGEAAQVEVARAETAAERLSAGLATLAQAGEQASGGLASSLAVLEGQAERSRREAEAGMRAIRGQADTLFEVLENTSVAKREAMARHSEAVVARLAEAQAKLEAMAQAAAGQLAGRLEALGQQAGAIEGRLAAQASATEAMAASGERAFQLLDARLAHSSETTRASLDRLAARVQDVNADLARLTQPLKDGQGAVQALDGAVKGLKETALQTVDVLGETLPARTVEAGRAAETLSAELLGLVAAIDRAHDKASALAEPIAEGRAALEAAADSYAAQRGAIEAAGHALVVELHQARTLIGQVEEQTRDTSLSAATRLVDAMTRVREVANQATGTMREMLDGVVTEARESLAAAADAAMRQSYAEPVARAAREAEAAAAAAAERTAGSMAALAGTLKLLEARSDDRAGKFEAAQQEELLAASTLLMDRLSQSSVSLATALGKPMDDADWVQWRRGERSLFNRRALALLDKREARQLKELMGSDPAFAQAAREYTSAFEALVRRFEPQAPALAAAIQGSEQGRLAAALSEVLGG